MSVEIEEMIGKTFTKVYSEHDKLIFKSCPNGEKGEVYIFYHCQDCCESVTLEDIEGNLTDLENVPLMQAEESSSYGCLPREPNDESYTWTFYKFATIKGYVTVRWYGTSNGYYSESVNLIKE